MRDGNEPAAWHVNKPGKKMPDAWADNNICICKINIIAKGKSLSESVIGLCVRAGKLKLGGAEMTLLGFIVFWKVSVFSKYVLEEIWLKVQDLSES